MRILGPIATRQLSRGSRPRRARGQAALGGAQVLHDDLDEALRVCAHAVEVRLRRERRRHRSRVVPPAAAMRACAHASITSAASMLSIEQRSGERKHAPRHDDRLARLQQRHVRRHLRPGGARIARRRQRLHISLRRLRLRRRDTSAERSRKAVVALFLLRCAAHLGRDEAQVGRIGRRVEHEELGAPQLRQPAVRVACIGVQPRHRASGAEEELEERRAHAPVPRAAGGPARAAQQLRVNLWNAGGAGVEHTSRLPPAGRTCCKISCV